MTTLAYVLLGIILGALLLIVLFVRAAWRVADRCVQVLGGQGVTDETVVARIFADLRAFRIYDGPSEVHRYSLARRILRERSDGRAQ